MTGNKISTERKWFQSRKVALLQCLLTVVTTFASYVIALFKGHVSLWPIPMISYCGVYAPEKYVFSIGLVCAAFLMFLFIWIVETAGKIYSSKFTAWALGFPCSIGLMVLAVCNCVEEPTLHYIGAFAYFVCFAIWCVVCSFKELSIGEMKTTVWVTLRKILALSNMTFSISMGVFYLMGFTSQDWPVSVSEWMVLLSVEFYTLTFFFDLGNSYFIEQVREDVEYTLILEDDEEDTLTHF